MRDKIIKAIQDNEMTDQYNESLVYIDSDFEEVVIEDLDLRYFYVYNVDYDKIYFTKNTQKVAEFYIQELVNRHGEDLPSETLVYLDDLDHLDIELEEDKNKKFSSLYNGRKLQIFMLENNMLLDTPIEIINKTLKEQGIKQIEVN